eukprot:792098-Pleurochrysis_carterae.AAC.1
MMPEEAAIVSTFFLISSVGKRRRTAALTGSRNLSDIGGAAMQTARTTSLPANFLVMMRAATTPCVGRNCSKRQKPLIAVCLCSCNLKV